MTNALWAGGVAAVVSVAIAAVVLGIHFQSGGQNAASQQTVRAGTNTAAAVRLGTSTITAAIADTPAARRRGLSGRSSLPEGHGMLFVHSEAGRHGIWMPDMHFPLDIIWLDDRKRVVHIERAVSPDTYPTTFKPDEPARYVLEVNAGVIDKTGLTEGDAVTWRSATDQ